MADNFSDSSAYQTLKDQLDQENFAIAWKVAQVHADEYLGDERFDFLYGIAALNSGNVELAVFAFERVVANKPNWLDSQYYLAKSYFQMSNYHAVIQLCQTLIAKSIVNDNLKTASEKLLRVAHKKLAQQSLYFQQSTV